jgi:hypothetical protein
MEKSAYTFFGFQKYIQTKRKKTTMAEVKKKDEEPVYHVSTRTDQRGKVVAVKVNEIEFIVGQWHRVWSNLTRSFVDFQFKMYHSDRVYGWLYKHCPVTTTMTIRGLYDAYIH